MSRYLRLIISRLMGAWAHAFVVFLQTVFTRFNDVANLRLNEFGQRIVSGTPCGLLMPIVDQVMTFEVDPKNWR